MDQLWKAHKEQEKSKERREKAQKRAQNIIESQLIAKLEAEREKHEQGTWANNVFKRNNGGPQRLDPADPEADTLDIRASETEERHNMIALI